MLFFLHLLSVVFHCTKIAVVSCFNIYLEWLCTFFGLLDSCFRTLVFCLFDFAFSSFNFCRSLSTIKLFVNVLAHVASQMRHMSKYSLLFHVVAFRRCDQDQTVGAWTVSQLLKGHVGRRCLGRNVEECAMRRSGTRKGEHQMCPQSFHICIDEEYRQ